MDNVQHVRTSLSDLIAMEVRMQPRMTTGHDMGPVQEDKVFRGRFYVNECTYCHLNGKHTPSNWSVTYADLAIVEDRLVVRRERNNIEVCNDHIVTAMENIRDYYHDVIVEFEGQL